MDSLFPSLQGLAPLQHVGLSRRTVSHPLLGRYSSVTDEWPTIRPSEFGTRVGKLSRLAKRGDHCTRCAL